jgi:hypothetical protein
MTLIVSESKPFAFEEKIGSRSRTRRLGSIGRANLATGAAKRIS